MSHFRLEYLKADLKQRQYHFLLDRFHQDVFSLMLLNAYGKGTLDILENKTWLFLNLELLPGNFLYICN